MARVVFYTDCMLFIMLTSCFTDIHYYNAHVNCFSLALLSTGCMTYICTVEPRYTKVFGTDNICSIRPEFDISAQRCHLILLADLATDYS